MNVDNVLFIISSYDKHNNQGSFIDLAYSTKGLLNLTELNLKSDTQVEIDDKGRVGPFESEEELVKFSYSLSEQNRLSGVCICNGERLNEVLKEATSTSTLNETLLQRGDVLENPEQKKSGLFSNLF